MLRELQIYTKLKGLFEYSVTNVNVKPNLNPNHIISWARSP